MAWQDVLPDMAEAGSGLLADFALAFLFFTALCYATLGPHFGRHRRPAIVLSVTLGLALSTGLVWWEQANGYSIRSLGPIAVGLVLILLALVIYRAFKLLGGTIAGAGLTLGLVIAAAMLLNAQWPAAQKAVNTVAGVAILIGLVALVIHLTPPGTRSRLTSTAPLTRHDMGNVHDACYVSEKLRRGFRDLRQQVRDLRDQPAEVQDVMRQLQRMLPAEGYLTRRMAELRTKAYQVRHGHVARLEETKHLYANLPVSAKKQAAAQLAGRYRQMIGIDQRLERLDRAVAATENRIRELMKRAQIRLRRYDHRGLYHTLKEAEKLQKHNTRLFALINRTQGKLVGVAERTAQQATKLEPAGSA